MGCGGSHDPGPDDDDLGLHTAYLRRQRSGSPICMCSSSPKPLR
jgi:hypothetical protein